MPKVTRNNVAVVIPTFNRASMVVDAVRSALAQTYRCRVVVVDDGSTDRTEEVVRGLGPVVEYIRQENRERGAARNLGAKHVADWADFLCFLDADDALKPEHVERGVELASTRPDVAFVAARAERANQELQSFGHYRWCEAGPVGLGEFLFSRQTLPPSTMMVRTTAFGLVGGFEERRDLAGSEDWHFTARLLRLSPALRGPQSTVLIRHHSGNSMLDAASMRRTMLLAHQLFFSAEGAALPEQMASRSRATLLLNAATAFYGVGAMAEARASLLAAMQESPRIALNPLMAWTLLRSMLGARASAAIRRAAMVRRLKRTDRGT